MNKVLVTGLNTFYADFPRIWVLIKSRCKGVKFPCYARLTGERADNGAPILMLNNGNDISSHFLQIAD